MGYVAGLQGKRNTKMKALLMVIMSIGTIACATQNKDAAIWELYNTVVRDADLGGQELRYTCRFSSCKVEPSGTSIETKLSFIASFSACDDLSDILCFRVAGLPTILIGSNLPISKSFEGRKYQFADRSISGGDAIYGKILGKKPYHYAYFKSKNTLYVFSQSQLCIDAVDESELCVNKNHNGMAYMVFYLG